MESRGGKEIYKGHEEGRMTEEEGIEEEEGNRKVRKGMRDGKGGWRGI